MGVNMKKVLAVLSGVSIALVVACSAISTKEKDKKSIEPKVFELTNKIVENAKLMAQEFINMDYDIISGGTDTHVILADLTSKNISGKAAEKALEKAGITVNKNMVPFDQRSPFITSGIRIGTPAITTRNMGIEEMKNIAKLIDRVIIDPENDENIQKVKSEVEELCESYPIYKEFSN